MKNILLILFVVGFGLLNAVVITAWNFDDNSINPSTGSGSLSLIGGVTNDGFSTGYPAAPSRGWSTTTYPAQGTSNRTAGLKIVSSSEGYTGLSISWLIRYSNTSANRMVLYYTADNSVSNPIWIQAGVYTVSAGDAWAAGSFDGSSIPELNYNPNLAFKMVSSFANANEDEYVPANSGSTYAGGKWRIDDIVVQGSPAIPYLGIDADLSTFYASPSAISGIQTYNITGANLIGASFSLTAPQYFYLRLLGAESFVNPLMLVPRNGLLSCTVQVVFQPVSEGTVSGNIVHSGGGIEPISLAVEGSTLKPTPSNYPTGFHAHSVDYYKGMLSWSDSVGGIVPDGYLIKGSKVSADDIIDPVDGVVEEDKKLTKNVPYGSQTQLIYELNEVHTYYFKIFPYTNSGLMIDYLASSDAPMLSFTTTAGPIGSQLDPGDLAFVEYASDSPDRFSFVLLKDVLENTKICLTDKAWNGTAFAATEEVYTWRGVGRSYVKGEVIHIIEGTLLPNEGICNPDFEGFSNDGDQIIAFQGFVTEPSFIAALSSTGWISSGTPANNSSYLPEPLVLGQNALGFTIEVDNGVYSGTQTGSDVLLLSQINDPAKWQRGNSLSNVSFPNWAFSVTGIGCPSVQIVYTDANTISLNWDAVDSALSYTVYECSLPDASFPGEWSILYNNTTLQSVQYNASDQQQHFFRVIANY
jgi:hypothetical protein